MASLPISTASLDSGPGARGTLTKRRLAPWRLRLQNFISFTNTLLCLALSVQSVLLLFVLHNLRVRGGSHFVEMDVNEMSIIIC